LKSPLISTSKKTKKMPKWIYWILSSRCY